MNEQFKGKYSRQELFQRRLYVGLALISATLILVWLLSTESFQKNSAARYVGSFVAGLFGFTAIETLRRSLD